MPRFDSRSSLSVEQRRTEVAALLARGVLRAVRARRAEETIAPSTATIISCAVPAPRESSPQSQIPLELSAETRLSVATGSGG